MPKISGPADTLFVPYAVGHERWADDQTELGGVYESGLKGNVGDIQRGSAGANLKLPNPYRHDAIEDTGVPSASGGMPPQISDVGEETGL